MATTQANQSKSSAWYIDSGALRHFTNRKDWFIEYSPGLSKNSVTVGGEEEFAIFGTGNMQLSYGGKMLMFLNVYYVPGMKLNMLLVSQIMRHCLHLDVNFSNHKCYIVDKESKKTIALGLEDQGLFRLVDNG